MWIPIYMININDKYYIHEYLYTYILVEFILHLNSNTKVQLKWKRNKPKETGKRKKRGPYQPGPKGLRATSALAAPLVSVGNTNRDQRGCVPRRSWQHFWSRLVVLFCPGSLNWDEFSPPFVPPWRSRLGNRDNRGFPTRTNRLFCSSESIWTVEL